MHRSLAKALAALAGAALLVAAPLMVFLAPAQASSHAFPGESKYNQVEWWVDYLQGKGYTDVQCTKDDTEYKDGYVVPNDKAYVLIVLKSGSGAEANQLFWDSKAGAKLFHTEGDISHVILCTGKKGSSSTTTTSTGTHTTSTGTQTTSTGTSTTSTGTSTTSTGTSTTSTGTKTTTHTGPVVETDRPSDGGSGHLAIVAAVATVLAGAGALVFSRRRQGDHR